MVLIVLQVTGTGLYFQAQMVLGPFSPDSAQADFYRLNFRGSFYYTKKVSVDQKTSNSKRPGSLKTATVLF